jgi:hypothetical protein
VIVAAEKKSYQRKSEAIPIGRQEEEEKKEEGKKEAQ